MVRCAFCPLRAPCCLADSTQLFQPLAIAALSAASLFPPSSAQFPPPAAYSTVIKSPINPGISVSYRSPAPGTCTTVFASQKQYTGYVSLPPFTLEPIQQNYSINTFFWFIEARQQPETAPLTIWLNGGPGSSSMIGLFQETGPCEVVQMADGTYGTRPRSWGWDRSSNILFIDQPAQVGLSYDTLTNASYDLLRDSFTTPPTAVPPGKPAYRFLNGTFGSNSEYATANTTQIAAHAVWHFLQSFLASFPQYNPGTRPNSTTVRPTGIHLFAESYGGTYGPAFAALFEEKNAQRAAGSISRNSTLDIRLTSLGLVNGMVDALIQTPFYPKFAVNNTYGIQALSNTDASAALSQFTSDGCQVAIAQCRAAANRLDPQGEGDVQTVNDVCSQADYACNDVTAAFSKSGLSVYDIRQKSASPFPSPAYQEYLNYAQVQSAIGARVNFTTSSSAVFSAFLATGDTIRATPLPSLANLLKLGVRVALLYGDADYICNWFGGEAVSLALAATLPAYAPFARAGYADIIVNSSYVGGAVRQFGNLSFARIYDAGHEVPAYQPEAAFTVFTRIIQGTDVSTGKVVDLSAFNTTGPLNATRTNKAPPAADPTCWIRGINDTCSNEQRNMILAGQGVVINGVLYQRASDYQPPSSSVAAGVPGTLPTSSATTSSGTSTQRRGSSTSSSTVPTGVYVATATPTRTSGCGRVGASGEWTVAALALAVAWVGVVSWV